MTTPSFFEVEARLDGRAGRTGTITTAHGAIRTPAFVPVGTKATVKAVLPEAMAELGAQALLANAYHLYLQPGDDVVEAAGGLGRFMGWDGPTFTDSGGFQVMSLGSGYRKTLSMDASTDAADVIATDKDRLAHVDEEGVTFRSHLDGSTHRFTPEVSMGIQHRLGADIIFAFDELTTLLDSRTYQEEALARTQAWAARCLAEHGRLAAERASRSGPSGGPGPGTPAPALFGVVQGAQHEDLRRRAARDLAALEVDGTRFDGFGIGGAIEKENLATIVGWVTDELPEDRPRHLLGIGEPDDLFAAVEAGADTFDCVGPSRVARSSRVYTADGRENLLVAASRRRFEPIEDGCDCYTCAHYTRAYLHHLFKAKEYVAATLTTIHNERYVVRLVDRMRGAIEDGTFDDLRDETLGRIAASR
ncbi:tRNA guanosine(34) transglycosylase Tgt [Aeromicrobium sp. Leaf272]|uniref:tRNA guanosine(34) transglycosylase Tgt n=1 Tax=Aeromicrobium sp. Leaf272 TaxID=1736317 RepID=UPI0006FEEE53|nr:tRNA guanosine(34) transglycosylase Tgt [Aeromicrobium sp. Leaf272]KQP26479.1 queuine tRNA-ribosyltransferase [Aeromicrobium sp. Leaf272]